MKNCCNHKLPTVTGFSMIQCVRISLSNGEVYTLKINDLVGIQFVKNNERIFVRKGRVKDIVIVNKRNFSTLDDNASHIILDCSEQYTIKLVEIKIKDIIKVGRIEDEFDDYDDRITELDPNFIEGDLHIPTREHGMYTEEEMMNKITKPEREDVVKMDPKTGEFKDLATSNQNSSNKRTMGVKGIAVMK